MKWYVLTCTACTIEGLDCTRTCVLMDKLDEYNTIILALVAMLYSMGLIQYYQITCQLINQAICIFIIVPIVL